MPSHTTSGTVNTGGGIGDTALQRATNQLTQSPWQFTPYARNRADTFASQYPNVVQGFGGQEALFKTLSDTAQGLGTYQNMAATWPNVTNTLRSTNPSAFSGLSTRDDAAVWNALAGLIRPEMYQQPGTVAPPPNPLATTTTNAQGVGVTTTPYPNADWSRFSGGPPNAQELAEIATLFPGGGYQSPEQALTTIRTRNAMSGLGQTTRALWGGLGPLSPEFQSEVATAENTLRRQFTPEEIQRMVEFRNVNGLIDPKGAMDEIVQADQRRVSSAPVSDVAPLGGFTPAPASLVDAVNAQFDQRGAGLEGDLDGDGVVTVRDVVIARERDARTAGSTTGANIPAGNLPPLGAYSGEFVVNPNDPTGVVSVDAAASGVVEPIYGTAGTIAALTQRIGTLSQGFQNNILAWEQDLGSFSEAEINEIATYRNAEGTLSPGLGLSVVANRKQTAAAAGNVTGAPSLINAAESRIEPGTGGNRRWRTVGTVANVATTIARQVGIPAPNVGGLVAVVGPIIEEIAPVIWDAVTAVASIGDPAVVESILTVTTDNAFMHALQTRGWDVNAPGMGDFIREMTDWIASGGTVTFEQDSSEGTSSISRTSGGLPAWGTRRLGQGLGEPGGGDVPADGPNKFGDGDGDPTEPINYVPETGSASGTNFPIGPATGDGDGGDGADGGDDETAEAPFLGSGNLGTFIRWLEGEAVSGTPVGASEVGQQDALRLLTDQLQRGAQIQERRDNAARMRAAGDEAGAVAEEARANAEASGLPSATNQYGGDISDLLRALVDAAGGTSPEGTSLYNDTTTAAALRSTMNRALGTGATLPPAVGGVEFGPVAVTPTAVGIGSGLADTILSRLQGTAGSTTTPTGAQGALPGSMPGGTGALPAEDPRLTAALLALNPTPGAEAPASNTIARLRGGLGPLSPEFQSEVARAEIRLGRSFTQPEIEFMVGFRNVNGLIDPKTAMDQIVAEASPASTQLMGQAPAQVTTGISAPTLTGAQVGAASQALLQSMIGKLATVPTAGAATTVAAPTLTGAPVGLTSQMLTNGLIGLLSQAPTANAPTTVNAPGILPGGVGYSDTADLLRLMKSLEAAPTAGATTGVAAPSIAEVGVGPSDTADLLAYMKSLGEAPTAGAATKVAAPSIVGVGVGLPQGTPEDVRTAYGRLSEFAPTMAPTEVTQAPANPYAARVAAAPTSLSAGPFGTQAVGLAGQLAGGNTVAALTSQMGLGGSWVALDRGVASAEMRLGRPLTAQEQGYVSNAFHYANGMGGNGWGASVQALQEVANRGEGANTETMLGPVLARLQAQAAGRVTPEMAAAEEAQLGLANRGVSQYLAEDPFGTGARGITGSPVSQALAMRYRDVERANVVDKLASQRFSAQQSAQQLLPQIQAQLASQGATRTGAQTQLLSTLLGASGQESALGLQALTAAGGLEQGSAELQQRAREISAQLGVDQAQAMTQARLEAQTQAGAQAQGLYGLEQARNIEQARLEQERTVRGAELGLQAGTTTATLGLQQAISNINNQLEGLRAAGNLGLEYSTLLQQRANLQAQLTQEANVRGAELGLQAGTTTATLGLNQAIANINNQLAGLQAAGNLGRDYTTLLQQREALQAQLTQEANVRGAELGLQAGVTTATLGLQQAIANIDAQLRGLQAAGGLAADQEALLQQRMNLVAQLDQEANIRGAELGVQAGTTTATLGVNQAIANIDAQLRGLQAAGGLAADQAGLLQQRENLVAQLSQEAGIRGAELGLQAGTTEAQLALAQAQGTGAQRIEALQAAGNLAQQSEALRQQAEQAQRSGNLDQARLLSDRAAQVEQNALEQARLQEQAAARRGTEGATATEQMIRLLSEQTGAGLSAAQLQQQAELTTRAQQQGLIETGLRTQAELVPNLQQQELIRTQVDDALRQRGFDNLLNLSTFLSGTAIDRAKVDALVQGNTLEGFAIQKQAYKAAEELAVQRMSVEANIADLRAKLQLDMNADERAAVTARLASQESWLKGIDGVGTAIGGSNWLPDLLGDIAGLFGPDYAPVIDTGVGDLGSLPRSAYPREGE